MCGIVGYIGKNKKAKDAVIKGLERLEYRGYDSAGIAYVDDNEVVMQKEKGRIKNLKDEINFDEKSNIKSILLCLEPCGSGTNRI